MANGQALAFDIAGTYKQPVVSLEFPCALLKKDHHDFLASIKDKLAWSLWAYENYGETFIGAGNENYYHPYAFLVKHIVDFDAEYGHTPTQAELASHLRNIKHEPTVWGCNDSALRETWEMAEAWIADNGKNWHAIGEAEPLFEHFFDTIRKIRVRAMNFRVEQLMLGGKEVYDPTTKSMRRSTYSDGLKVSENIAKFDWQGDGKPAAGQMPEIPEAAVYGWLGDKARESGMPLGYIYPALLGTYAGNRIKAGKVHPGLYIALLGDVETGKSQAIERAQTILDMGEPAVVRRSASSDRGLFRLFGDDPKAKDAPRKGGGTFVMCLTELRHMLSKMSMENNSLTAALCALWDNGKDFGTADKFANVGCNVTLSIVGGLKCNGPDEFSNVFGHDTMHGLYSRFLFTATNVKWEYQPDEIVPERRDPAEIVVGPEIWERLTEWRKAKGGRNRLAELAMRVAVISEAADKGYDKLCPESWEQDQDNVFRSLDVSSDPSEKIEMQVQTWKPRQPVALSMDSLEAALRFMEWQEALRGSYQPSEAIDDDARCTEALLKAVDEHGSFKWNTVCKNRHWTQKWGASRVARIRGALVATGQISYDKDTGFVSKG